MSCIAWEGGIFAPGARVELIEGVIVDMTPIGSAYASRVRRLNDLLAPALHGRAIVAVQDSIRLGAHSEPQPDLAVLRYRDDFYADRHPGPEETLPIIEVADTSGRLDREVKVPLYARHAIPEVWLLDLQGGMLEVYRDPRAGAYHRVESHQHGSLAPGAFPDLVVDVAALLG